MAHCSLQFEKSCSKRGLCFLLHVLLFLKFIIEDGFMYYLHIFTYRYIREREHWGNIKKIKSNKTDFLEGS